MAGSTALACANAGASVMWCAPTYKQSRPLWRFVERLIGPVSSLVTVNKTEREVTFPSGGTLMVYSADAPDSIRGNAFDLVIIDEAARVTEEAWTDAIQPTLADRNGHAYLISTPHGRNWFYREFIAAKTNTKDAAAFTAPSSANPNPNIKRAAELARTRVPERTYRQEWLAEFVADGTFFQNIEACATATEQAGAYTGHAYVMGVDWARASGGDYTVFLVVDVTTRSVAYIVRLNGMDYGSQTERLKALWRRFGYCPIIAEQNAMGGPLIEKLQSDGLNITAFVTTIGSKHDAIVALDLAFDQKTIAILNDPILIAELQSYERNDRAGIPSYSAPKNMHDDEVMALAIAWTGVDNGQNWGNL